MTQNSVSLVVPTYNERDTLRLLVERIHRALNSNYEIIIVDDNSPDGTGTLAEELSKQYPIKVIRRKGKLGLSTAAVEGFKMASSPIIGILDADLQHPPEVIPSILKALEEGADLVVGSRYVEGGSIEGWNTKRRIVSYAARWLAKLLFPDLNVKDTLSGFFFFKRNLLETVDLNPEGYKIILEFLVKAKIGKIVEVPYTFRGREKGKSKFTLREQFLYLKHLYRLAKATGEFRRLAKFCTVGFSGVFVNTGLLFMLTEYLGIFYLLSSVIAIEIAILSNFIWNDVWTFKGMRYSKFQYRLAKFDITMLIGLCINVGVLHLFTEILGIPYLISNLVGIVVAVLWNFLGSKHWIWKR